MSARGTVYLVGAGPGAPDLLTLRAADLLRRADIVFHDALVHPDTLALAGRAEKVAVGKRCGRHSTAQRFINKRLIDAAGPIPGSGRDPSSDGGRDRINPTDPKRSDGAYIEQVTPRR